MRLDKDRVDSGRRTAAPGTASVAAVAATAAALAFLRIVDVLDLTDETEGAMDLGRGEVASGDRGSAADVGVTGGVD